MNVNAATRDIVKVVLTESNGKLGVHGFGACEPTPCDWGEVTGQAYAATVSKGGLGGVQRDLPPLASRTRS